MTGEDLLTRARELGPVLRERAARAAENRRLPDETIGDFKKAGFFRVLQPTRYGGYEMSPQVLFDLQMTIGGA